MKLIDLESHFLTREFADYASALIPLKERPSTDKLFDLGEGRLKDMDEVGIDRQVLSLFQPPHIQNLEPAAAQKWARSTNEELAEAVSRHPDRFIGLAAIPVQSPDEAAKELERAVVELGLKGACVMSNARGEYYDDQKYWGIFDTTQKLDVPIYLHPSFPSATIAAAYSGYEVVLGGPPHGFYAEVSLHVMRLICSGLFDRYPGLKIILGHMGEGLPFWLPRLDFAKLGGSEISKKPSEYLKSNFTVTTSGMFFTPALICAYLALGADCMAFGVDYPLEDKDLAVRFMEAAPICDSDKEKIGHANAEALFKI